jgi:two-component system, OmpR family, sensor histidine kinase VicK
LTDNELRLRDNIFDSRMTNDHGSIAAPRIDIISNHDEIKAKFLELVDSAKKEILIVFPTQAAFQREEIIGVNEAVEKASKDRAVNVRLLSPINDYVKDRISIRGWKLSSEPAASKGVDLLQPVNPVLIREIDVASSETKITFCIFDSSKSLAIELKDNSKLEFEKAIGFATYSNSKPTVASYLSFFEKLWHESELRESETLARKQLVVSLAREAKATRQAKLLQDIIAHDIANYNQIIKLHIELLEDLPLVQADAELRDSLKTMMIAIDGSSNLLERARKLGKVLSDRDVKLSPKKLLDSIESSFSLVAKANPSKKITNDVSSPAELIQVFADDFIDEIFANIYSNSVKYTDSNEVNLTTIIEDAGTSWLIRISDNGRGIPDEGKMRVFDRYSGSARGSGLGMSIVRALVIDRYGGAIKVSDRIHGDYSKGTSVEVWIPKASARS